MRPEIMHRFLDRPLKNPLETMEESIEPPQAVGDALTPVHRFRPPPTFIPKRSWQQRRSESGIIPNPGDHDGREDDRSAFESSPARQTPAITSRSSPSVFDEPSIAAATILGIITFAALLFLAIYYIRHKRRRRQHKRLTQNQDFGQSEITLGEDTSKTLDDFLMKGVPVERTSFMFSRSQSPSITYVVDETERPGLNKQKRNSYGGGSSNSLSKLDPLTRISTDATRPSLLSTEFTVTSSQSTTMNSSSKPASGSATPRTSMSSSHLWKTTTGSTEAPSMSSGEISSTAAPTARSSQMWTTTTESTETGSLASGENQSRLSNTSGTSSRPSSQHGPLQIGVTMSNAENTSLRRYHARSQSRSSQSRSSQSTIVPPVAKTGESTADPRLSNGSTTPTMFRFSES